MSTFIDTSVLIPLSQQDSPDHGRCRAEVDNALVAGPVIVSDIVYAEFAVAMDSKADVDAVIRGFGFARCGYSDDALYRASQAFRAYRANGGPRQHLLPDFLIGALAEVEQQDLITRDAARIRTYFPNVNVVEP